MMKIRDEIKGKDFKQRCNLKGKAIKESFKIKQFKNKKIRVVIDSINKIDDGIEVYARAYKGKKKIGFGENGTVDIERFRIFNPPTLVDDENGDIEIVNEDKFGVQTVRKLRFDPEQALQESLLHIVNKVGKDDSNIIKGKVGNTTTTFYPSYDALLFRYSNSAYAAAWDSAHNSTTADAVVNSALPTGNYAGVGVFTGNGNGAEIARAGIFFNTYVLGEDTISSATISVYPSAKQNTNNDGRDYINIVLPAPASNTALVVGDFDLFGAIDNPTQGATAIDIGSITTGAYNDWTLNATGLTWINKTGISLFGFREGHDIEDVLHSASANQYNSVTFYHSEQAGTSSDPTLIVVHSESTTVQTSYEGSNDDYMNIGTTQTVAQGFQVPSNCSITSISFYGSKGNTSSGTLKVEICSGTKDAAALTSVTISSSNLTAYGSPAWNKIILTTPIDAVAGTQYFLRLEPVTGSTNDEVRWSTDTTSTSYSSGTQWILTDPSSWTEYTNRDGSFRIYGVTAASSPNFLMFF